METGWFVDGTEDWGEVRWGERKDKIAELHNQSAVLADPALDQLVQSVEWLGNMKS